RPRGTADGDDAHGRVGEQVDGDALLRGAPVEVEQGAVTAHEVHALVGTHAPERGLRTDGAGDERDPGVARQLARHVEVDDALCVQRVDHVAVDVEVDEARPARI